MVETVQVDDEGHFFEDGDCLIPGLRSMGSRVQMTFTKPAGAMTGKLLPTGRPMDTILLESKLGEEPTPVRISAVDSANPFVFVDATTLPKSYHEQGPSSDASFELIENVRRQAAVMMSLAGSAEEASKTRGTPKIAVLKEPAADDPSEIQVLAYSMGKVHGSLQLTGAVCLGTAACTEGTLAHAIRHQSASAKKCSEQIPGVEEIKLRHPGGEMDVKVNLSPNGQVDGVAVFRTARRLFEGTVYYLQ